MSDATLPVATDAAAIAPEQAGATLLAFPGRPKDRLRLALWRLEEALAAQRDAVAAWRAEIAALGAATAGLGRSVHGLQDNLAGLAGTVAATREEALRLERTADAMLAVAAGRRPG